MLILNTVYPNLPQGLFNLLLSCRLRNLSSSSDLIFHDYNNCTLHEAENGDYTVKFKIGLSDIVNKDLCARSQITTGNKIIFIYGCEIVEGFFATEYLPDEEHAILLKKNINFEVWVDSMTKTLMHFSVSFLADHIESIKYLENIITTPHICGETCDGTDSNKTIFIVNENITAQINIDGELANSYLMTLGEVNILENGTFSYKQAAGDCTQLAPKDNAGKLILTCLLIKKGDNITMEIFIKLDKVNQLLRGRALMGRGLEGENNIEDPNNIDAILHFLGPYSICGPQDEECINQNKQQENVLLIEPVEEDKENGEKNNNNLVVGLIVGMVGVILISALIIVGVCIVKRKRKAKLGGMPTTKI